MDLDALAGVIAYKQYVHGASCAADFSLVELL